jgi:outer membrane protein OmpA-like peptidoglycan-associated protein
MRIRSILCFAVLVALASCASVKRLSKGEPAAAEDATPPTSYAPTFIKTIEAAPSDPNSFPRCRLEISWIDAREPNRVRIFAHLVDTSGNYYSGATLGKYRGVWCDVSDSSKPGEKRISKYALKERQERDKTSIAVSYVLDHSGSMGEVRARAIEDAVYDLAATVEKGSAASVVKYDDHVTTEVPLTTFPQVIRSKMQRDGLDGWGGGTAIADAFAAGMESLKPAELYDRRAVVLFTDGLDNSSTKNLDSVVREARRSNTIGATLAFGDYVDEDYLKSIAERTGGIYRHIYGTEEMGRAFEDLYHRLRNYYVFEYTPPSYGLHKAEIQLCLPNDTLAASGYYDNTPRVGDAALLDINFDLNSSAVLANSYTQIEDVVTLMKAYPNIRIDVRGHTDSTNQTGDANYNQKLSERRAQAVKKELAKRGIASSRIESHGFGDTRPVAENDTEEGRARNRRTEFVIVSN